MSARRRIPGPESEAITIVTVGDSPNEEYKEKEKDKYPNSWKLTSTYNNLISKIATTAATSINSTINTQRQLEPVDSSASSSFDKFDLIPETPEFMMTARDRTLEFSNTIRSLQGRNIQRAVNIKDPRKAKQLQSYSEFMMIAKHIGKNIASTYAKLEKLTLRK